MVDDEKSIVFALRQYFRRQSYIVDCAESADQALELLAANHYALAIIDVELRGNGEYADGVNLAYFVRTHAPATGVIMLSAHESPEVESRARKAGAHSFVHKPAPLAELADVAAGVIRSAALNH